MRDLVRYPITKIEILECLESLANDILEEERVGDMRPLLLQVTMEIVKRNSPPETQCMPTPESS